jgi:hypothetical protein
VRPFDRIWMAVGRRSACPSAHPLRKLVETANHPFAQIRPMLSFVLGSRIHWTGWTLAIVTFRSRSSPSEFAPIATRLRSYPLLLLLAAICRFVG